MSNGHGEKYLIEEDSEEGGKSSQEGKGEKKRVWKKEKTRRKD
jgi:hypothetical protein